jgi:hypothetical protein
MSFSSPCAIVLLVVQEDFLEELQEAGSDMAVP